MPTLPTGNHSYLSLFSILRSKSAAACAPVPAPPTSVKPTEVIFAVGFPV